MNIIISSTLSLSLSLPLSLSLSLSLSSGGHRSQLVRGVYDRTVALLMTSLLSDKLSCTTLPYHNQQSTITSQLNNLLLMRPLYHLYYNLTLNIEITVSVLEHKYAGHKGYTRFYTLECNIYDATLKLAVHTNDIKLSMNTCH